MNPSRSRLCPSPQVSVSAAEAASKLALGTHVPARERSYKHLLQLCIAHGGYEAGLELSVGTGSSSVVLAAILDVVQAPFVRSRCKGRNVHPFASMCERSGG